jgi:hypothetical protein
LDMGHATHEPYPLTHACAKAEWAKCHLDELREAVSAFCADSHTVTAEPELERDQVRHRVRLNQPHVSIYLICGDYLQCLRTALDQAVWSLVNHRTGLDSESSEFPVFEDPLNSQTKRKFDAKIAGLSDAAIDYIKSIQPYNRPAGTPLFTSALWCLHELNRIDKHRRISVQTQLSLTSVGNELVIPGAAVAEVSQERTDYGFDVILRGAYKHFKPEITALVIFGEPKRGIVTDVIGLAQLHSFVADEVLVALASRLK